MGAGALMLWAIVVRGVDRLLGPDARLPSARIPRCRWRCREPPRPVSKGITTTTRARKISSTCESLMSFVDARREDRRLDESSPVRRAPTAEAVCPPLNKPCAFPGRRTSTVRPALGSRLALVDQRPDVGIRVQAVARCGRSCWNPSRRATNFLLDAALDEDPGVPAVNTVCSTGCRRPTPRIAGTPPGPGVWRRRNTMLGDFPPSSSCRPLYVRGRCLHESCGGRVRGRARETRCGPRPGARTRARFRPWTPYPVTTLMTPSGTPASMRRSAIRKDGQ